MFYLCSICARFETDCRTLIAGTRRAPEQSRLHRDDALWRRLPDLCRSAPTGAGLPSACAIMEASCGPQRADSSDRLPDIPHPAARVSRAAHVNKGGARPETQPPRQCARLDAILAGYQPNGSSSRPSTYSQMPLMRPSEKANTMHTSISCSRSPTRDAEHVALHRAALPVAAFEHLVARARHPLAGTSAGPEAARAVERPTPEALVQKPHVGVVELVDGVEVAGR